MCAHFVSAVHFDMTAGQLNQDFPLIREQIMKGLRPKFEDATAPLESVVSAENCSMNFDS